MLAALAEHAVHLPRDPAAPSPTREERLIAAARSALAEVDLAAEPWSDADVSIVDTYLASMDDDLKALSDAITYYYFSHAELRVS